MQDKQKFEPSAKFPEPKKEWVVPEIVTESIAQITLGTPGTTDPDVEGVSAAV